MPHACLSVSFQLNDALLYTTQVKGGYKLNNELSLCGMKVGTLIFLLFDNEAIFFHINNSLLVVPQCWCGL